MYKLYNIHAVKVKVDIQGGCIPRFIVDNGTCRGPAPVDTGNSKGRRLRRTGYNSFNQILIRDIKSNRIRIAQQENSVEKRG